MNSTQLMTASYGQARTASSETLQLWLESLDEDRRAQLLDFTEKGMRLALLVMPASPPTVMLVDGNGGLVALAAISGI